MTVKEIKKLSRRELEQSLEQMRELSMRQQRQLIAKNRMIEHLSENARNWTKKFRANDPQPPVRSNAEANTEIAQEIEIQELQSKLTRLNELNLGLVKRLAKMQESQEEAFYEAKRASAKTNASAISQNTPKIDLSSAAGAMLARSETTVSTHIVSDKVEEISELEFSPEMQSILAKYAA